MYEEKSTEQIAKQVGLSENATRQLIFRARSAFKKALIGDVDTTGMSAGAILSVAARKAAQDSKKIGASAMALIALVVMSLAVFPTFNRTPADQLAGNIDTPSNQSELEIAPTPDNGIVDDTAGAGASGSGDGSGDGSSSAADSGDGSTSASGAGDGSSASSSAANDSGATSQGSSSAGSARTPAATPEPQESPFSDASLKGIFDSRTTSSLFLLDETMVVFADNGVSATFKFNPTSDDPFKDVFVEFEIGEAIFAAYPNNPEWLSATDPQGQQRFVYFGALNYVYDEEGKVWSKTDLAKGTLRIEVILEENSLKVKQVLLAVLSKG
jgi:hypothetical protein